jgi:hypothetical protein
MVPSLLHASLGHRSGSAILPLSISTCTVCEHERQRKNATRKELDAESFLEEPALYKPDFMSGITGVARMTSPLIETILSVSIPK